METTAITQSVVSLFIIILVGVYGSRKKIITPELNKGLTDILIKIALPFMIVSSFMFTYDDTIKPNVLKTFYYSIGAYAIMAAVSFIFLIPVIIYLISLLLEDASKAVYSVIIMTAMPASTMTSILAESFDKEKEFAAIIVSATTLISLITVPVLLKLIT